MADVVAPHRTRYVAGDTEHRQRLYQRLYHWYRCSFPFISSPLVYLLTMRTALMSIDERTTVRWSGLPHEFMLMPQPVDVALRAPPNPHDLFPRIVAH